MCYVRSLLSDVKPNPVIILKVLYRIGRVCCARLTLHQHPQQPPDFPLPQYRMILLPASLLTPYSHHHPSTFDFFLIVITCVYNSYIRQYVYTYHTITTYKYNCWYMWT